MTDSTQVGARAPRPKVRRRFWVVLCAAVAVVVVVGITAATVLSGSGVTKRTEFQASTASISNPERGWYDSIDSILTERDFSKSLKDHVSLLFSYVRLDAFRDSPIDQTTLAELQQGLDAVRNQGLKIVLRFAYNAGPYPDSQPDASESRILEHLTQLTPVLKRNSDVIAVVQAGFIGAWGEWHTSTNGLATDQTAKATILAALLAAVPASRDVQLRYPSDLRALEGTPLDTTVPDGSAQSRIGNHQDCFLSGEPDDDGTWSRDGNTPAADKKLVAAVGRYAPVGGETCNADVPATTTCTKALDELAMMHFSFLNRDYEPNTLAKFASQGCYDTIGDNLGYRLNLVDASMTTAPAVGGKLAVDLTLRNVGYASPYNSRPAYIVVRGKGHTATLPLATDVRSWDPGADIHVQSALTLPAALTKGTYTVSLWLPDDAADLKENPAYAIQIASVGVWQASTGTNLLGTIKIG